MSTTQLGYGCLLKFGNDASPQIFNTIAEVSAIGEFGSERGLIDKTNFDSADAFMEYILGLKDGVELTVTANFLVNNATQNSTTGLIKAQDVGAARDFKFVIRDTYSFATQGTFNFAALVRAWRVSVSTPALLQATFNLKVTGPIVYQAGV